MFPALVLALTLGTTSQHAFERCGETFLTVSNNTSDPVEVQMFGQTRDLPPHGTIVMYTDDPVPATTDRVTRRRPGQTFHTSITSVFHTEHRPCTLLYRAP